jgi:hypothetical protein
VSFKKEEADKDYDKRSQEHKNGNAVNAMHIFHPSCVWSIRVSFFYVEIFGNLS